MFNFCYYLKTQIVLILAILVAVAYTLETASIPIVDNQDLGVAGSTIPEAVLPDLNAAEHKKKKYRGKNSNSFSNEPVPDSWIVVCQLQDTDKVTDTAAAVAAAEAVDPARNAAEECVCIKHVSAFAIHIICSTSVALSFLVFSSKRRFQLAIITAGHFIDVRSTNGICIFENK